MYESDMLYSATPPLMTYRALIKNTPDSGVSRDQPEPGAAGDLAAAWVRPGAEVKTLACEVVKTSAIARVQN
jgi:hypothetical protein